MYELGIGEMMLIRDIWRGDLQVKMHLMETNYPHYLQRARMVASMATMYRQELMQKSVSEQHFWLHWAARHGKRIRASNIFNLRYRGAVEHFALAELASLFALLVSVMMILSVK